MAAQNNITGKYIKTPPPNKAYRAGWDKVFVKKSTNEWLEETPELNLIDAAGWEVDKLSLDSPISFKEFQERLSKSISIERI
jgi:hypothetical protein